MVTGDLKEALASDLQKLAADLSEDDVDRLRRRSVRHVPSSNRPDFRAGLFGHRAKVEPGGPSEKCKNTTSGRGQGLGRQTWSDLAAPSGA